MNFPPFWARGDSGNFSIWRWSANSLAEAQSLASAAAQKLAAQFQQGQFPPAHGGYYPDRPMREQVLQEIKGLDGQLQTVVSRNSYGCQVLNCAQVMFVDIDLPEAPAPRAGFFQKLFGKPAPAAPTPAPGVNEAVAKVQNWTRANADWGWRIYRTRAGLRLLATQGLVDPNAPATDQVLAALESDPLYRKLCQSQKCFRARLTPKPWRCGIFTRPDRWPWPKPKLEERFKKWNAAYETAAAHWATCQFIAHAGNTIIHPDVQRVIKLHDEVTRVGSNLELA